MKKVLVTGSTGFLGRALVPRLVEKYSVYALVRNVAKCPKGAEPLCGDVTLPDLGIRGVPQLDEVWNIAGIVNLRGNDETFPVNCLGALHAAQLAVKCGADRLVHVSTAYCYRRNPYEWSKELGDEFIRLVAGNFLPVTVFKPSIMVADSRDLSYTGGAFYQFIQMLSTLLERKDNARRWHLALSASHYSEVHIPPLSELSFKVTGNPQGTLNIIPVDAVARAMVDIQGPGIYYLTHPSPPTLGQIFEWLSEILELNLQFKPEFEPTPLETVFLKMIKSFLPYLQGDNFPSSLAQVPEVDRDFVQHSVALNLLAS